MIGRRISSDTGSDLMPIADENRRRGDAPLRMALYVVKSEWHCGRVADPSPFTIDRSTDPSIC